MAELGLVDNFVMEEAIGIVATLFVSFYYSRKQMQKLSIDIETKVLSDLDEKIHGLTQMAVEKQLWEFVLPQTARHLVLFLFFLHLCNI
jgi:hypothetical protein